MSQTSADEFIEQKVLPEYRPIVAELRNLMKAYAPEAIEVMSYGVLSWRVRRIIAVISPARKGITFAFSRGADFEDSFGLLEGVGHVSKNVRMKRLEDINREAMQYYIKQALQFEAL